MTDADTPGEPESPIDSPPTHRVVIKFGGTSVRDAPAIRRLTEIVGRDNRERLIVVSALAAVTDQLVDLASRATAGEHPALGEIADAIQDRHVQLVAQLVAPNARRTVISAINDTCLELRAMVHAVAVLRELSPRSSDAITSFDETLSSRLVAARLVSEGIAAEWVDARRVLVTDASYGHAQPDMGATTARVQDVVAPLLGTGRISQFWAASSARRQTESRQRWAGAAPTAPPRSLEPRWTRARSRSGQTSTVCSRPTHGSFPTPDSSRD